MNPKLWSVPVVTEFAETSYLVSAETARDARRIAGRLFERYNGLAPAYWDQGVGDQLVRTELILVSKDEPFDRRHDGYHCAIGKPEPFELAG